MTHQEDYNLSSDVIEELTQKGFNAVPDLLRVLLNNAMQAERSKYLQAGEYERTEDRKGHANGFKPKTVKTRLGEITFAIPQVREGGFYPSALEKGMRSERDLVIALAEIGPGNYNQEGKSDYRGIVWCRDHSHAGQPSSCTIGYSFAGMERTTTW